MVYELIKMVYSEKFINLLKDIKELEKRKDIDIVKDEKLLIRFIVVYLIELAYLVYTAILLFTPFWYVGLVLIGLTLLHKKRLSKNAMHNDGLFSIIIMSLVFFL
jgi:uncharacterized membrane protein YdbT with pleckstrin-like domain